LVELQFGWAIELDPGLEKSEDIFDYVFSIPNSEFLMTIRGHHSFTLLLQKVFFGVDLASTVAIGDLLVLDGDPGRVLDGCECIDDFDDSVFQLYFRIFDDLIALDSHKVVSNFQILSFFLCQFHLQSILMSDGISGILEILYEGS
jgi:hypothetical protein